MAFVKWQANIVDAVGDVQPLAQITVRDPSSGGLLNLYSDDGVTPKSNPFNADSNGAAEFWARAGLVDITATLGGFSRTWSDYPLTRLYADSYSHRPAPNYGAELDGSTDDLTAINSLITDIDSERSTIDLNGKTAKLSADPTNPLGVAFQGGKVLVPSLIAGQDTQFNTYADEVNGLMIARENLAAWWKSVTAGTIQSAYIFGDSTVEMDGSFPLKAHELFKNALFSAGVNNVLTVNRGVSGTSWSDLNAIPDLGASTKLIVIKYGINDAVKANPLDTLAADARTKLTAIRAATNGDFDNLSILLMGPSCTYAPTTDQDAKWYEDLRNVYLQLCKEFDCAYFDTYAFLQQTKNAPGLWMDDIGGGEGIHPDPVAAYWIWVEGIKTFVLGDGQWNTQKSNQFWNINNFTRVAFETSQPQTYPYGTTVEFALAVNGFPFDGVLITTRHADGVAVQTLSSQDVVPRTATRRGGGLVWTQFAGVSNDIAAFLNSWVNVGGGYDNAGYQVQSDGFVELFGGISSGVSGASAFQLPVGARPAFAHRYLAANNANIIVFADGNVIPTTADTTHVSLDGIRFKVL